MPFDPKENRFLHSLPGGKPAAVAPAPKRAPVAPVTPHMMPVPGQKHTGPPPGRWDKLQQYLQRPPAAAPAVKPDGEEPA